MKLFDEYLKEQIDTGNYDLLLPHAAQQFMRDYLVSKQIDPLDEWKNLKPGRECLCISTKLIWRFSKFLHEYNDPNHGQDGNKVKFRSDDGQYCIIEAKDLILWQIIQRGPFDISKIKLGKDYVFVTGIGDSDWDGWQLAEEQPFACDAPIWIRKENKLLKGIGFLSDGTRPDDDTLHSKARLHFSPPTELEDKIKKAAEAILEAAEDWIGDDYHPEYKSLFINRVNNILKDLMNNRW